MNRCLPLLFALSVFAVSCSKTIDNTGTCSDGIRNQGEQAVDCGGPCATVCPSCADGVMNQGETATDCGGPCDPCYPRMAAMVDSNTWSSTSRNAFLSGPGTVRMYGTNQQFNITLYYSGSFKTGTVAAGNQFTGELRDENGNLFSSVPGGSITFTTFDTTARIISGTYHFTGFNSMDSTEKSITNGIFNVLNY